MSGSICTKNLAREKGVKPFCGCLTCLEERREELSLYRSIRVTEEREEGGETWIKLQCSATLSQRK